MGELLFTASANTEVERVDKYQVIFLPDGSWIFSCQKALARAGG